MRPTVTEQLDGVCDILDEQIGPALSAPHHRETLRNLVANLRMLSRSWPRLLPFLLWDNDETAALLARAGNTADAALGARIDALLAARPDGGDPLAVESRNEALRELLAAVINVGPDVALRADIQAHLRERSRRYPLRVTGAQPKRAAAGKARG